MCSQNPQQDDKEMLQVICEMNHMTSETPIEPKDESKEHTNWLSYAWSFVISWLDNNKAKEEENSDV
jgi:hypothetical protein